MADLIKKEMGLMDVIKKYRRRSRYSRSTALDVSDAPSQTSRQLSRVPWAMEWNLSPSSMT